MNYNKLIFFRKFTVMDYSRITELDLSKQELLADLSLYTNLKILSCSFNQIRSLDNLPLSLETLTCDDNKISYLDNLPSSLIYLHP